MPDNKKQDEVLEKARDFVREELSPIVTRIDKRGKLPKEIITKMAQNRFIAAPLPKRFGGLGLDPMHYGMLTEVIGKACCATRTLLTVHTSLVGETITSRGSDTQKEYWLPLICSGKKIGAFALSEPEIGTDAKGVQTTYQKKGHSYVINGIKKWISFGDIADFFIVIARNVDSDGITAFIVDRDMGIITRKIEGMLAGRGTHLAEVKFQNLDVSQNRILGRENNGFSMIANTALDYGRFSIAWAGVAISQAALEAMVKYSRNRKQFGEKLCNFQLIQGIIGDAISKTHAARALCLKASEMRLLRDTNAVIETTIAKYFASKVATETTANALQIHGANGCTDRYPVEKYFREAKILEIIEGTSQILQLLISKFGLNEYYEAQ